MQEVNAKETVIHHLETATVLVNNIRKLIINEAGRIRRPYTDEEEFLLERYELALHFIKKAKFEIQRSDFKVKDEVKNKLLNFNV